MTDLTDRLRALADDLHSKFGHNPMASVMSEAADRIEALEKERIKLLSEGINKAAEEFLANRDRQGDQK